MTKQRKLILAIIQNSMEHLTADEIFIQAKKLMPSIAVGTVYRNLGLMVEAGEVKKLPQPNGPDRYDKSIKPHEHLCCSKCGSFLDLPDLELKPYIEQKAGIEVESYELHIEGICSECLKKR